MDWEAFVGVPYVDRGRAIDGADCWGLVVLVYARQGVTLPAYLEYRDLARREREALARVIDQHRATWMPIAAGAEHALDLVLLRVLGQPSHIGVVVEPGRMLHVSRGATSCLERYRGPKWSNRIAGFYRYSR